VRGPEPRVAVQPRSAAELAATLDGITAVFASCDVARFDEASLAAEQLLTAFELATSVSQSDLVAGISLLEPLRGQELAQYVVMVREAVGEAAGPVRELHPMIQRGTPTDVQALAYVAVDALRHLVAVAEVVP